MSDIKPSLTAHIDLLGFSEHLALARYDPRSKIGTEALNRLGFIEKALNLIEAEQTESPDLLPKGANYMRLNDSLLLQMDIDESYLPTIGNIDIYGPTLSNARQWATRRGIPEDDYEAIGKKLYEHQAKEVAKFLGVVARTHNFLNLREEELYFPGCRTVVASGLRKPFLDRSGNDDFLAINFSLANAYSLQERGSDFELKEKSLYLDDNIARVIAHHPMAHKLLYFAQFVEQLSKGSPYNQYFQCKPLQSRTLSQPHKVDIDICRQRYTFTQINPAVASNLQLVEGIDALICGGTSKESMLQRYAEVLSAGLPTREAILSADHPFVLFPFYFGRLDLSDSIARTLESFRKSYNDLTPTGH
jgi:hypothetical protein